MTDTINPLVSVGIPTYNRAELLPRAVESVLAQDYANIEVVISDNASADATQALSEELCRRDSRVRYLRQPTNIGLVANYAEVFRQSCGELYIALADDDWLEPNYVSECLQEIQRQPDLAVVCGKPRMFRGQVLLYDGVKSNLLYDSPEQRVLSYLAEVVENGAFHGVMRRDLLAEIPPMSNALAGDWVYVASIAYKGKIRTIDSTAINKSVGGTSRDWESIVRTQRLPWYHAKMPYLHFIILWCIFKDIAWASPVYIPSGRAARLSLACKACWTVARKLPLPFVVALLYRSSKTAVLRSVRWWRRLGRQAI
jgi:glycosyltransferase involved in cell wall biosynthesis